MLKLEIGELVKSIRVNFPFQNYLVGVLHFYITMRRMELKKDVVILSKFRNTNQVLCVMWNMQQILLSKENFGSKRRLN